MNLIIHRAAISVFLVATIASVARSHEDRTLGFAATIPFKVVDSPSGQQLDHQIESCDAASVAALAPTSGVLAAVTPLTGLAGRSEPSLCTSDEVVFAFAGLLLPDPQPTFDELLEKTKENQEQASAFVKLLDSAKRKAGTDREVFDTAMLTGAVALGGESRALFQAALVDSASDESIDAFIARFQPLRGEAADPVTDPATTDPEAVPGSLEDKPDKPDEPEKPTKDEEYAALFAKAVGQRLLNMVADFDPTFLKTSQAIADKFSQLTDAQSDETPAAILAYRKRLGQELLKIIEPLGTSDVGIAQQRWKNWYNETGLVLFVLQVQPDGRQAGKRGEYYQKLLKKKEYKEILTREETFDIKDLAAQKRVVGLIIAGLEAAMKQDVADQQAARSGGNLAAASAAGSAVQAGRGSSGIPDWYRHLTRHHQRRQQAAQARAKAQSSHSHATRYHVHTIRYPSRVIRHHVHAHVHPR